MSKVIGLDLGTKTLGIAISDSLRIIATGVENFEYPVGNYDKALERVAFYIKRDNIHTAILGLPLHMSGEESERSLACRSFKERLEKELGLEVILIDERWSTKSANSRMLEGNLNAKKRKSIIDKMSAVVILETYLQSI